MSWFRSAWNALLPPNALPLVRGRAGLVAGTALGIAAACAALLLTWLATGDLEAQTALAAVVLVAILAGIVALARSGRVTLASWLLVVLLTLLVSADVGAYGLGSPSAAAYCIPLVLAAFNLGPWAGLGVAGVGTVVAWLSAWGEVAGWYAPLAGNDLSHLTFEAPVLTIILLAVALMAGLWSRYVGGLLSQGNRVGGNPCA